MARTSKKKSVNKRSAKPAVIDVPTYDSNVKSDDLVLINRGNVDYSTDIADLAEGIGAELEIDSLVGDINTEIGDLNASIGKDLSDLEARVEKNETDIGGIEVWLGNENDNDGSGDTITDRVLNLEDADKVLDGKIDANTDLIKDNTTNIAVNKDAIDALEADQERQDSWTGAGPATNTGDTFKKQIEDNAAAIGRLQGALVYRGVGDFSTAPDTPHQADFYLCAADGPATGWTGLSNVEKDHYYAYDGSVWQDSGSHSVVIEDPGNGALEFTTDNAIEITAKGPGFTANNKTGETYSVSLDLNDEGGLEITGDGLGINPKPDSGIIVNGDGIQVDPNFISGIAGPVPSLEEVTGIGATSSKVITVAGVTSTGDQDASTFLHKDISMLPALRDA